MAQLRQLGEQLLGTPRSEDLLEAAVAAGPLDVVEVGCSKRGMQRLNAGRSEAARVQERRQAGRIFLHQSRVGAHRAGLEEFGDERGEPGTNAVNLPQSALGSQLLEGLGYDRHGASRAAVRAQAMTLFAGHLQALGNLFEQSRHHQIAGPAGRLHLAWRPHAWVVPRARQRRWYARPKGARGRCEWDVLTAGWLF